MVAQTYEVEADNEYVIRGNAAVMKCEVPSFVSDFVTVENWQDSQGNTYLPGEDDYGTTSLKNSTNFPVLLPMCFNFFESARILLKSHALPHYCDTLRFRVVYKIVTEFELNLEVCSRFWRVLPLLFYSHQRYYSSLTLNFFVRSCPTVLSESRHRRVRVEG